MQMTHCIIRNSLCIYVCCVSGRIDFFVKVIQARQATLHKEIDYIQELLKDLNDLRNNWQSVWNEVTTITSSLDIEIKLPSGGSSVLRRNA